MTVTTTSRSTVSLLSAVDPGALVRRRASRQAGVSSTTRLSSLTPHQETLRPQTGLRIDDEAELAFLQIVAGLRAVRTDAGLTQEALSSHLPVRGRAISEWETGQMEPTLQHLLQWCRALNQCLTIVRPDCEPWQGSLRPRVGENWEVVDQRRMAMPLRNRRNALGTSQTELGRRVGVSRDSIQRWELCRVSPRPIAHVVWAQKLGCSVVLQPVRERGLV